MLLLTEFLACEESFDGAILSCLLITIAGFGGESIKWLLYWVSVSSVFISAYYY